MAGWSSDSNSASSEFIKQGWEIDDFVPTSGERLEVLTGEADAKSPAVQRALLPKSAVCTSKSYLFVCLDIINDVIGEWHSRVFDLPLSCTSTSTPKNQSFPATCLLDCVSFALTTHLAPEGFSCDGNNNSGVQLLSGLICLAAAALILTLNLCQPPPTLSF